eukprot:CAMPEP_0174916236 /NCGR_PEP_ID=MMETSP1355-20121228/1674_1 /TAXON_ID=464990 /ORGANISM="Hemiselmis tepida, Strain CCMP443" /LENGTH=217 /DNA_ID=CAMNT_0016161217 /DNA_START=192 /DNA_END=847 /DNA_ORIENTATION=-
MRVPFTVYSFSVASHLVSLGDIDPSADRSSPSPPPPEPAAWPSRSRGAAPPRPAAPAPNGDDALAVHQGRHVVPLCARLLAPPALLRRVGLQARLGLGPDHVLVQEPDALLLVLLRVVHPRARLEDGHVERHVGGDALADHPLVGDVGPHGLHPRQVPPLAEVHQALLELDEGELIVVSAEAKRLVLPWAIFTPSVLEDVNAVLHRRQVPLAVRIYA